MADTKQESPDRRPYEPPRIVSLGSVADLTRGAAKGAGDGGTGSLTKTKAS